MATITRIYQLNSNPRLLTTCLIQYMMDLISTGKAVDFSDKQYISCITPLDTVIAVCLSDKGSSLSISGDAKYVRNVHEAFVKEFTYFPTEWIEEADSDEIINSWIF